MGAGLLVGFGTSLGHGCTSGHGYVPEWQVYVTPRNATCVAVRVGTLGSKPQGERHVLYLWHSSMPAIYHHLKTATPQDVALRHGCKQPRTVTYCETERVPRAVILSH